MNNLFSVFDPTSAYGSLNWMAALLPFVFIPCKFWLIRRSSSTSFHNIFLNLYKEFFLLNSPLTVPGISQYVLSLFSFIWLNNLLSLFPYIFSSTAHPALAMTIILPLWLGQFFYNWLFNTSHMLAHLVPASTPIPLVPIIVLIELTRNLIRPLTLTVRLVANISAGHLLLVLIGSLIGVKSSFFILLLITVLIGRITLLILELGVSLIQAYVFSMLLTLFIKEVNTPSLL